MQPISERGRHDIAELVAAAIGWSAVSASELSRHGRVSRATIDRVKRCDEVSETMLRALGDVLRLPRDFLIYVGRGDVERIVRATRNDLDLMRWTVDLVLDGRTSGDISPRTLKTLTEMGLT